MRKCSILLGLESSSSSSLLSSQIHLLHVLCQSASCFYSHTELLQIYKLNQKITNDKTASASATSPCLHQNERKIKRKNKLKTRQHHNFLQQLFGNFRLLATFSLLSTFQCIGQLSSFCFSIGTVMFLVRVTQLKSA